MNTTPPDARRSRSPAPPPPDNRPSRSTSRPVAQKRDSSPMARILTYGLVASNAAMGAVLPHRHAPPRPQLQRVSSKFEEDMRAAGLHERDAEPYPDVDWQQATANVDWDKALEGVDWSTVSASSSSVPTAAPTASNVASSTTTQQADVIPTPTSTAASFAAADNSGVRQVPMNANDYFAGVDKTQNAVAIVWHGSSKQTFSLFANAGPYQPGFGAWKTVEVDPGQSLVVQLPTSWSGRIQKMTGEAADPATWAEFACDQWQGLMFYDASYIRGYNGAIVMRASDGSGSKGSHDDFISEIDPSLLSKDSKGTTVIPATEGYDGSLDKGVIEFYRAHIATSVAYARNFDDAATGATPDKHLIVDFYA